MPFIVLTLKSLAYMLRHRFDKEPKSELMSRKGSISPLTLILVALISRIYALLHVLVVFPNVKLLFTVDGIILVVTDVRLGTALYA